MIRGFVTYDNQAVVRLTVLGNANQKAEVEPVLDTGFNGSLSLPPAIISKLQLVQSGQTHSELADGSKQSFDLYEGVIDWEGEEQLINIHQSDSTPLLGTRLLAGYRLTMDVEHEGTVTIQRLVEVTS